MAGEVEYMHDAFPYDSVSVSFPHRDRLNKSRNAAVLSFHSFR
jgi:hypothetical protein